MWAPQVEQVEALKLELTYFVECIQKGTKPFNDGCAGLKVVRMLEAANESVASEASSFICEPASRHLACFPSNGDSFPPSTGKAVLA